MAEERWKVLEMLAAGTISVEQADQLLEAIGPQPAPRADVRSGTKQPTRAAGLGITVEELIELREHDVDADYLHAVRAAGFSGLSVAQIIELREHDVDADYLKALRDAGFSDLPIEQIVELRDHDVDADYLHAIRDAGFTDLSVQQIVELREHDVDADYLQAMRKHGIDVLFAGPKLT